VITAYEHVVLRPCIASFVKLLLQSDGQHRLCVARCTATGVHAPNLVYSLMIFMSPLAFYDTNTKKFKVVGIDVLGHDAS